MKTYKSVNEYVKQVPKEFLSRLEEMRSLMNSLVPQGVEVINYGIPTIQIDGKNFIHYAAVKGHLGFYPSPSGITPFESQLKKRGISFSKGCIRLPYDKPLPVTLIRKIIASRLREERAARRGVR